VRHSALPIRFPLRDSIRIAHSIIHRHRIDRDARASRHVVQGNARAARRIAAEETGVEGVEGRKVGLRGEGEVEVCQMREGEVMRC
jgi:hypothetical protein